MVNRRRVRELSGESIREVGILGLVFAPLDAIFEPGRLAFPVLVAIALFMFAMIVSGTIIESAE